MDQHTISVGTADWLKASRDMKISAYGEVASVTISEGENESTKEAFQEAMRRVSQFPKLQVLAELSSKAETDTQEAFFVGLANQWHEETDMISSPSQITSHLAYRRIISMGSAAIPFILRDLLDRGGDWYAALEGVTGVNPIPIDASGDVPRMKEAWVRWARKAGYID